jgi:lipopolysaccharide export system protein LptA
MKFAAAPLGMALALALSSVPATAQQTCRQVLPSDFRRVIDTAGQEILYFRQPVRVLCTGGAQLEADSAVMNQTTSILELTGRVLYRDGDRQLTSDWARYLGQSEELFARGEVVLTDLANGSVITGDDFEFRRETATRPESRMIMRGRRPQASLTQPPGADGQAGAPLLVWGRRLEFLGETVFLAHENVELERETMRGAADAARFDQAAERMILTGNAHVRTDEYRLEGDHIDAYVPGEVVSEVLSEGRARLEAEDLTVQGRNIRIAFADGQPERVEAWNPPREGEGADAADGRVQRAVALSRDFRLRADSIDARSPAGRLEEVRAVGRAFGEREADEHSRQLPDPIARDWIQGDTIIGYFAEPDTTAAEPREDGGRAESVVLERIEAIGGESDALSLYRTEAPGGGARPALNFVRAQRVTLFMVEGDVSRVELDGPVDGLYLDPVRPAPRPDETPGVVARRSP